MTASPNTMGPFMSSISSVRGPDNVTPKRRGRLFLQVIVFLLLVALPVVTFWPTVFHRYGFRDDYSIIQEANEEPGKVFVFCTSFARPVYGTLLEISAEWVSSVDELKWMRLCGTLIVGLVSAFAFLAFRKVGWAIGRAALLAAIMGLLPATQIISGWAICWPHALGALLGILAFLVADRAMEAEKSWQRVTGGTTAVMTFSLGALCYQSNSLFYLVPLAAGFVLPQEEETRRRVWRMAWHFFVVCLGLALAYATMCAIFEEGLIRPSHRVVFESDPLGKLWWFIKGPLQNALAVVIINNEFDRDRLIYEIATTITTLMLAGGAWREWRMRGSSGAGLWMAGLVALGLCSFLVNLVVSDRYIIYRTIWPLTSVLLVFAVSSLSNLLKAIHRVAGSAATHIILVLFLLFSVMLARSQSYELIALPQSQELKLVEDGARNIDPVKRPMVFIVTPTPKDSPVAVRWADEFGSLTTDSDWTGKEMLELTMKRRFPKMDDVSSRYTLKLGRIQPSKLLYNVIIDMRNMGQMMPK